MRRNYETSNFAPDFLEDTIFLCPRNHLRTLRTLFIINHHRQTMSNILSVFNPPPPRDIPEKEYIYCLPCTAIQAAVGLGLGFVLRSPNQFKDPVTGKIDLVKNPLWWQRSVRSAGFILLALGAYRAGEVVKAVFQKKF